MNFRYYLRTGLGLMGLVLLMWSGSTVRATSLGGNAPNVTFASHGPVVGGVTDTTAVIFVRASTTSTVKIQYSLDPTFLVNVVTTPGSQASLENDYTVQTSLSGLLSETTYYYRVLVDDIVQTFLPPAHFVTFPPNNAVTDFSFVVIADADNSRKTGAPAPILAEIAALQPAPAFVMQIGDWDHRDPATQSDPPDIAFWRTMHKDVLADDAAGQDFAQYIAPNFPLFHMWDDHDYGANSGYKDVPWKALATKAFKEYFPLPPLANPTAGLWFTFRYAQAQFFMLDLRSQRDSGDLPDDANKSMLAGDPIANDQKTWLKQALSTSTARWKFIISTVSWNPTVVKPFDAWYAYQTERQELSDYIQQNNISGVVFISGDLHTGGAIDDGQNSAFPEISVPNMNLGVAWTGTLGCTSSTYCGTWSEGWYSGTETNGYALITITSGQGDQARLQTWATHLGDVLTKTLIVQLPVEETPTPTLTQTRTPTSTLTRTRTLTPTQTRSPSATLTVTTTPTTTSTRSPTPTPTYTPTRTLTPSVTATPVATWKLYLPLFLRGQHWPHALRNNASNAG